MTVITAIAFGIAPGLQAAASNISETLKLGGQRTSGVTKRGYHNAIVVTEMALALAVLTIAAMLANDFIRLQRLDLGLALEDRLVMSIWIPSAKYREPQKQFAFYDRLLAEVTALPGVRSAAIVQNPPLTNFDGRAVLGEGYADIPENLLSPQSYFVSPDYTKTMGIPLLRGRVLTERDNESAPLVALVSESLAEQLFPNEDAIGKRIRVSTSNDQKQWHTIVGVVGDVRQLGPEGRPTGGMYLPAHQFPVPWMNLVVHASAPLALTPSIRKIVAGLDPDVATFDIARYEDVISDSVLVRRTAMLLTLAFGGVSLFLSAIGLYGLVAYVVSTRMHEFGIRSALGAQRADLLKLVVGSGARLILAGTLIGICASFAAAKLVSASVEGLSVSKAAGLGPAVVTLLVVAFVASIVPARAAANVDPALPLRTEG